MTVGVTQIDQYAGSRDDYLVAGELGEWEPFSVEVVARLMGATGVVWWLSGGIALERFVGRPIRTHGDIDVSIRRADLHPCVDHLTERLEVKVARDGRLRDLDPAYDAETDDGVHGLWARERGGGPWRVQINLEPCEGDDWVYRREPRVRRALAEVIDARDGIPCVNPAVQLLWKARDAAPKDEIDLAAVLPRLARSERVWLAAAIALAHPESPWRERIEPPE